MSAMWLLMVEAGGAMFLLVFIVWWTMFSGRKTPPVKPQKTVLPKDAKDN
jgi:hypothetical protein